MLFQKVHNFVCKTFVVSYLHEQLVILIIIYYSSISLYRLTFPTVLVVYLTITLLVLRKMILSVIIFLNNVYTDNRGIYSTITIHFSHDDGWN